MSMTYTQFALRLAAFISIKSDDIDWSVILPATIDAAEMRCYRELDFVATINRNSTGTLTPNYRRFDLPTDDGTWVTVQSVNVITPPTASLAAGTGTRNQLMPVSPDFLDSVYDSSLPSMAGVPKYFAIRDNTSIILGPWPDAAYNVEVVGTIRPAPLSASNTTTFLTLYLPDLFFNASMAFFSRAIMEYGAQTQDGPGYWEAQYQTAKASAMSEEMRKKFAFGDWVSHSAPVA
jgi:hypothetical protein